MLLLAWLAENLSTILIAALLAAVLAAILIVRIRSARKGKGSCSCGCGCSECSMKELCHAPKKPKEAGTNGAGPERKAY